MRRGESAETVQRRSSTQLTAAATVLRGVPGRVEEPLQGIAAVAMVSGSLAAIQLDLVRLARSQGATWQQVADTLGISRQAAWERFSAAL